MVWADAQQNAHRVHLVAAHEVHDLVSFGIVGKTNVEDHLRLMRRGMVPMVNPEVTWDVYRPLFRRLEIGCGMVVSPATVLDLHLRTLEFTSGDAGANRGFLHS